MTFEAAKCPACGASIQVPDDVEQAKCMYCGSTIVVKDDIQKLKIEVSGQVSLSGISSVENDIERGYQCLKEKDWEAAYRSFQQAVGKQANNYMAWYGCLVSITQDFTFYNTWTEKDGINGIQACIRNCLS